MDKSGVIISCAETNVAILSMTLVFLGLTGFIPPSTSQYSIADIWQRRRTAPIRILVACMTFMGILGLIVSVIAGIWLKTPLIVIAVSITSLTGILMGTSVSMLLLRAFKGEEQ